MSLNKYHKSGKRNANKQSKYSLSINKNIVSQKSQMKQKLFSGEEYIHKREYRSQKNIQKGSSRQSLFKTQNLLYNQTNPNHKNEEDQIKKYNDLVAGLGYLK